MNIYSEIILWAVTGSYIVGSVNIVHGVTDSDQAKRASGVVLANVSCIVGLLFVLWSN